MIVCPKCKAKNDPANVTCHRCGFSLIDDPSMNSDPHIGRVIGGRYKLMRNLGSGEVGMVYEGLHESTQRRVAVKIIHPDVAHTHGDELLRWAKRTAQIRHAKVAGVLGAMRENDGITYIVTEFLEGDTLMQKLRASGPMDPMTTADILFQLCSALAPIHRAGRPHANLKPENVFLLGDENEHHFVKIVDIGSPTLFGIQKVGSHKVIVGTAKYFSPEQASGVAVGLPSDQFTVGIIGYLLLTGALPFYGATPPQLLESIIAGHFRPVRERAPKTPDALAEIIHRCLAVDPYSRFKDLRALAKAFASVIKSHRHQEGALESSDSLDVSNSVEPHEGEATIDPDSTMLISVPSELRHFLGKDTDDLLDTDQNTEELMPIPQPLSFTGELDSEDIQAAIEDALDVFGEPRNDLSAPQPTLFDEDGPALFDEDGPALSEEEGPALSEEEGPALSEEDGPALSEEEGPALFAEDEDEYQEEGVGEAADDALGHLFDEALEELSINSSPQGLNTGASPASTNQGRVGQPSEPARAGPALQPGPPPVPRHLSEPQHEQRLEVSSAPFAVAPPFDGLPPPSDGAAPSLSYGLFPACRHYQHAGCRRAGPAQSGASRR